MPRPAVIKLAPAKLNLALAVGPPGVDGMHPICSWMVPINLYDLLEATRLEVDRLSRYAILWHGDAKRRSEIDWPITRDLAVRAHLALERHVGRTLPTQLKLEKRIPVGGGLGGGSSDAAAMLNAINELFELGLSVDDLARIAQPLGSDVPFFVHGTGAIVEGLGDRVERQSRSPDLHAVIVFPPSRCVTRDVYRAFDEQEPGELRAEAVRKLVTESVDRLEPEAIFNDLADPALRVAPSLAEDLQRVGELAERPAHITGSGSTLFVVCDDSMHAEALAGAIEERLDLPALAVGLHDAEAVAANLPGRE